MPGFCTPVFLSADLAEFLDIPFGDKMPRVDVTRNICEYIKDNDLQNPENRRQIQLDDKLRSLFGIEEGQLITYSNMQKYLKPHFSYEFIEKEIKKADWPTPEWICQDNWSMIFWFFGYKLVD